jgi:hypothetical protein
VAGGQWSVNSRRKRPDSILLENRVLVENHGERKTVEGVVLRDVGVAVALPHLGRQYNCRPNKQSVIENYSVLANEGPAGQPASRWVNNAIVSASVA